MVPSSRPQDCGVERDGQDSDPTFFSSRFRSLHTHEIEDGNPE